MQDDFEKQLQTAFAKNERELRDESFVSATLERIERDRSRYAVTRFLAYALGVLVIGVASPFLIAGMAWLSNGLELAFFLANRWLETTLGMVVAVACSFAILATRARIARLSKRW
jgi:hypothetical protein